jgi:protoporphyrinogen oxidase
MRIGIIGGGPTGLALGYRLSGEGRAVVVFERDTQLGGLATHHDYGPFVWDRFYHVILPSDTHLIRFLSDIGLERQIRWSRTLTGFYVNRRYHSLSSSWEFLRFPLVTPWGKLRLAATILYCSRLRDWQRLEQVTVEEWLIKTCGRRTYERLWKPLLLAKLGDSYRRVSALFIWCYIKRLFSARDVSARSNESLGYVSGGYGAVWRRVAERIEAAGGEIRKNAAVRHIRPHPEGGLWIEWENRRERFDKVVFTSPLNVLQTTAARELLTLNGRGDKVEYLGVVCMALVTRKPLVPYYVVNIADERIPFTGVIGMSNLVSLEETAGRHLTYLPKYVLSDDPFLRQPDEHVRAEFFRGIDVLFPDLRPDDIEAVHINRAMKVQPLQVLNYSTLVPTAVTEHPDFFILNTSQFVNGTLNNNEVVRAVNEFVAGHGTRLRPAHASHVLEHTAP